MPFWHPRYDIYLTFKGYGARPVAEQGSRSSSTQHMFSINKLINSLAQSHRVGLFAEIEQPVVLLHYSTMHMMAGEGVIKQKYLSKVSGWKNNKNMYLSTKKAKYIILVFMDSRSLVVKGYCVSILLQILKEYCTVYFPSMHYYFTF